ncbi:hypothetical protein ASPZODRAFT_876424 [Penicilliopsis zonata CBS 506.65]|uniref:U4/U6.U5 small nuclear ribonucleoprotein 27kDa protein domain-containing protein n=1 Tax=Penicilliopsis zonata CBS 506.65 TaxID=1073090 RepID=A0A1L9S9L0_9EURO|nr:hypothetical protein ASPZODRAFT_876424 [Penicilliopsis zonata CBS 506.65]OJJ43828.1 hypothetical protein ASPZODRAFT_876424 [Penicilliopsis zonata CBS 506.65]
MAEPPTKRARRTDSARMWEISDKRRYSPELDQERDGPSARDHRKEDARRGDSIDDRRYRSRSRDRKNPQKERSRSRDRRDRDRDRRDTRHRDGWRDRERSVSSDRHQDRRGYPKKADRFRSRSPIRNGTRDRSRTPPSRTSKIDRRDDRRDTRTRDGRPSNGAPSSPRPQDEMDVDENGDDDFEELMRKKMGFSRFRSTKNTKVPGNNIYGVRKEKKTEYRQYMNRTGGFNRPLSPS